MKNRMRNLWKNIKALLLGIFISIILLEIACMILIEAGYFPTRVPTYNLSAPTQKFWAYLNEDFGAWHYKNATSRHTNSCFDVIYTSNSYGARDIERQKISEKKRFVVLGDSFVEGYGVADSCRFTHLLEARTGIPHLNFASSGGMGPTQYYRVYETLAKEFDHDGVMVGILPDNDFQDDYPNLGRYQPYWEGSYPDYQLKYTGEQYLVTEESAKTNLNKKDAKWFFRTYSYTMNLIDWLEGYLKVRRNIRRQNKQLPRGEGRFDHFTQEEFDRMRYSLEKICRLAGEKPVVVFLIPRFSELIHYSKSRSNKLKDELKEKIKEPNLIVVDLLSLMHDYTQEGWIPYFLPCDRHWSCHGHEIASDILYQSLKDTLY